MLAQGTKVGRKARASSLRSLLIPMCLGPCLAQNPYAGAWATPFNHQVATTSLPNPNATDPGSPFGGLDQMIFYTFPPLATTFGWPGMPGGTTSPTIRNFEAIHMSLIPKGVNRGKVLVWDEWPVLAKVPATFDPGLASLPDIWWSFQAYAIVDLRPVIPAQSPPRFQNFLLPIERVDPDGPTGSPIPQFPFASDLFCAGHCLTRFGDVVVVGGTTFDTVTFNERGPVMTFVFNPALDTAPFPTVPGQAPPPQVPLYVTGTGAAARQGLWVRGPDMREKRWYATATLTARINRVPSGMSILPTERVLILGGSAYHPGSWSNSPMWNNYEAFIVNAGVTWPNSHGLIVDFTGTTPNPVFVWPGPGTPPLPGTSPPFNQDWLIEYPRCHWLSSHVLFCSGYATRGSWVDHEIPGSWSKCPPQTAMPLTLSSAAVLCFSCRTLSNEVRDCA